MNFKAAHKYQLNEYKKSVMIYYLVVFLVIIFFGVAISIGEEGNFQGTGGLEMATVIFLFVVGLNSFKETFLMLIQNGISRKTMFLSRIGASGILCTVMMVIDRIIINGIGKLAGENPRFQLVGFYEQAYFERSGELGFLQRNMEGILYTLCFYLASVAVGYFITSAYYRMNKAFKIAVSVGVPVSFFFIMPIVDLAITEGRISRFIGYVVGTIFGMDKEHPYNFIVACLISTIVFYGLSWLLIRKAVDKK